MDEEEKRLEAEVNDELLEMYDDLEEPASLQLVEDFQGWILLLALHLLEKTSIIIIIPLLTLGLNKTVLQKTISKERCPRYQQETNPNPPPGVE